MTDELLDAAGAKAADVLTPAAEKNKPGRPPAKPKVDLEPDALQALRDENAALLKMVMEMQAKLFPNSEAAEKKKLTDFNRKAPHMKIRGIEDGVYYIQNGKRYNGKFELMGDA
jgi:hypothetical protein